MLKKIIATIILLIVVGGGAVAAFLLTQTHTTTTNKMTVVASFYPLYDFAKEVGGDKISASNVTPAGAEPHDYEPSAKDLMKAYDAKVFIYDGGQLEPWAKSFLTDYSHTAVKASQHITLKSTDSEEGATAEDPHFWLDPVLAQQIVNNIRDGFSKADPANAKFYAANAASYNQKLAELSQEYQAGLKSCKLHTVITSHQAFSYLAARYNFTVDSISGVDPDAEPSPAKMAELTNLVRKDDIRYIFFESLVSPRLADTIASETGAKTLVFDPIEGLSQADQDKGKDYLSVQKDNLKNLRIALDCQ